MTRVSRILALFLLLACGAASGQEPVIEAKVEKRGDAFIIDSNFELPVPLATAWEVFTDFDNMTRFLGHLKSSTVTSRSGDTLIVRQEGAQRVGFLSFDFLSERQIKLEPPRKVHALQLSGTLQRYASELSLSAKGNATLINYHAEITLDSGFGRVFGAPVIESQTEEQFAAMYAEMLRRKKL